MIERVILFQNGNIDYEIPLVKLISINGKKYWQIIKFIETYRSGFPIRSPRKLALASGYEIIYRKKFHRQCYKKMIFFKGLGNSLCTEIGYEENLRYIKNPKHYYYGYFIPFREGDL